MTGSSRRSSVGSGDMSEGGTRRGKSRKNRGGAQNVVGQAQGLTLDGEEQISGNTRGQMGEFKPEGAEQDGKKDEEQQDEDEEDLLEGGLDGEDTSDDEPDPLFRVKTPLSSCAAARRSLMSAGSAGNGRRGSDFSEGDLPQVMPSTAFSPLAGFHGRLAEEFRQAILEKWGLDITDLDPKQLSQQSVMQPQSLSRSTGGELTEFLDLAQSSEGSDGDEMTRSMDMTDSSPKDASPLGIDEEGEGDDVQEEDLLQSALSHGADGVEGAYPSDQEELAAEPSGTAPGEDALADCETLKVRQESKIKRKRQYLYRMRLQARANALLTRSLPSRQSWSQRVRVCRRSLATLDTAFAGQRGDSRSALCKSSTHGGA